jgi:hypothetical protein
MEAYQKRLIVLKNKLKGLALTIRAAEFVIIEARLAAAKGTCSLRNPSPVERSAAGVTETETAAAAAKD